MLNSHTHLLKKSSGKNKSKTGKKLLSAVDTVDPVLDDLEKLAKNAKTVGKDWEQPTDKQVTEWLKTVEKGLAAVQKIEVARRASKQASRSAMSAMSPIQLALASPPAVAGQSVSQHVVSAHRFLVDTAREGHTNARIALDQMKKELAELQSNVSEITAKGQNLAGAKLTLKDIKEVLNCIDYVITLKDHITRMLIFFPRRVENVISNQKLMFNLILLQTNAIQIWASLEQFKDIAKMYKDISNPHLVDGLHLVDLMTRLPKGSDFASQLGKMDAWKKAVQGQVDQIVEQQILEVNKKLNEEKKELLESRFKLPDPPKRQQLAIQQGGDEARKEINYRIEEVNSELKYMGKTHQDQPIEELKKDFAQLESPSEYISSMCRPKRN
ncbi:hypothetical protein EAF00_002304 [Botryotinia globosa]|nr:hypothetical protein EAF00_002304 [Botryotinia globosa]